MKFEWKPGEGIDYAALERMKQHFPKPKAPPHEAWFYGGPSYWDELAEKSPEEIELDYVNDYLSDVGRAGVKNFGRRKDWVDWFLYLLPHIIPRMLEEKGSYDDIIQHSISYFINLYSRGIIREDINISPEVQRELAYADYEGGIEEEYSGFREDVFSTLGRITMESELWSEDDINIETYWWSDELRHFHYFVTSNLDIPLVKPIASPHYAIFYFCLMYLEMDELADWINSLGNIKGFYWELLLTGWLDVMYELFWENGQLREVIDLNSDEVDLGWYAGLPGGVYGNPMLFDHIPRGKVIHFWEIVNQNPDLKYSAKQK